MILLCNMTEIMKIKIMKFQKATTTFNIPITTYLQLQQRLVKKKQKKNSKENLKLVYQNSAKKTGETNFNDIIIGIIIRR